MASTSWRISSATAAMTRQVEAPQDRSWVTPLVIRHDRSGAMGVQQTATEATNSRRVAEYVPFMARLSDMPIRPLAPILPFPGTSDRLLSLLPRRPFQPFLTAFEGVAKRLRKSADGASYRLRSTTRCTLWATCRGWRAFQVAGKTFRYNE